MVDKKIEEFVGLAATKIAKEIGASGIITIEQKKVTEGFNQNDLYLEVLVTIFKKVKENTYSKHNYSTKIKKNTDGSIMPVKELLMEAISKRYLSKGDTMVCVVDESVSMGYKSLMLVFEVDKILFNISTHNLAENINPNVIEGVIDMALEIGKYGREERRIGTGFIVGDRSEIMKYTKQLIVNPFSAYSDEAKSILDPNLRETIKEFAQLDGVFVIDKDGTIVSCGTYLDVDTTNVTLYHGYGTRHRNIAALTKETNAIGVVVSQSGGKVTIFKDGKAVMRL